MYNLFHLLGQPNYIIILHNKKINIINQDNNDLVSSSRMC